MTSWKNWVDMSWCQIGVHFFVMFDTTQELRVEHGVEIIDSNSYQKLLVEKQVKFAICYFLKVSK